MSVVKINAIEVEPGRGPALEERFAKRASEVEKMPGFLGFELLRPTDDRNQWLVLTRWRDQAERRHAVGVSHDLGGGQRAAGGRHEHVADRGARLVGDLLAEAGLPGASARQQRVGRLIEQLDRPFERLAQLDHVLDPADPFGEPVKIGPEDKDVVAWGIDLDDELAE